MYTDPTASIISAADTAGENAASSFGDRVQNPNVKLSPTLDPANFLRQSQSIQQSSFESAGLPAAFERVSQSGQQAQNALDIIASKYKQEELKKLPLDEMKAEEARLMSAKYRVLPDMLARTDLTDYKQRINLADQLIGSYDSQINSLASQRDTLQKAAENRAQLKVDEMKAQADILQQKAANDKFDLQERLNLYQTGKGDLQTILSKAVDMAENNRKLSQEATSNPFVGLDFSSPSSSSPAAPSFSDYVRQLEQQASATPGTVAFDSSPQAMGQYQQQYDSLYGSQAGQLAGPPAAKPQGGVPGLTTSNGVSVDQLKQDYAFALAQTKTKQEASQFSNAVSQAMASKNLDLAQRIIEGQKKELTGTELEKFGDAVQLENDILQLQDLYQKAESQIGPVAGTLSKLNPYNEDIKVLQARIAGSIVGLSHTLYGQALRGPEAAQLQKTLGDPSFPIGAAQKILDNTLRTLHGSLKGRISAWKPYYQTMNLQEMLPQLTQNGPRFQKSAGMAADANAVPLDSYLHSLGL